LDVNVDAEMDVKAVFSRLLGVAPESLDPEELAIFTGMDMADVMEQVCVDIYVLELGLVTVDTRSGQIDLTLTLIGSI
jgi:hypothetical protein